MPQIWMEVVVATALLVVLLGFVATNVHQIVRGLVVAAMSLMIHMSIIFMAAEQLRRHRKTRGSKGPPDQSLQAGQEENLDQHRVGCGHSSSRLAASLIFKV